MSDTIDFDPAGTTAPRRGRPPGPSRRQDEAPAGNSRADEVRARRRRRDDITDGRLRHLHVPDDVKDSRYVYRWINDEPGRVQQMTVADDWDIVGADPAQHTDRDRGVGTLLERVVDKSNGKKAMLVRKLREYYEEDEAKKQRGLDEIEQQLKRGVQQGREALTKQDAEHAYIPAGGISIKTG